MKAQLTRPPALSASHIRPKPFIAVPAFGAAVTLPCVNGLLNLMLSLQASGITFEREFLGNESLIPRARNRLVARFLETDCTHLLFIDADVGFKPKDASLLFRADLDVIVGAYPMKDVGWAAVAQAVKDGHPPEHLAELGGLYAVNVKVADARSGQIEVYEKNGTRYVEVLDAATGFMLIKRSCIEAFIDHYRSEIAYRADYGEYAGKTHHNVFGVGLDPTAPPGELPGYLSEDYHFCRKWQQMGGKVHLAIDAQLSHTGVHIFEGDVGRLFLMTPVEQNGASAAPPDAQVELVSPST